MSILAAIAVLAILIIVHELGHFLAARLQGIYANRFSIGFGSVIWKYQGSQTEYALRALPLGGFVGFPDDDPDSDIPPNDPNLLRNRPILDRAIVISAGVIANLVFAYLILVIQISMVGVPDLSQPGVLVPQVVPESSIVAYEAGIKAGDIILAVDGQDLGAGPEAIKSLQKNIQESSQQSIEITIERSQQILSFQVKPEPGKDGKGKIGIGLQLHKRSPNLVEALGNAAEEYQHITVLTARGFWQLISNFGETAGQVAGPVKIVDIGAQIASSDPLSLFQFAALISINLAIINILPLPALDGGQLVFLIIEAVRGKPLPTEFQQNVMQTGLVVLLGLGIFLIVRDTANLDWVQKLLQ
ncbi:MAG: RIP metalloprotease RseP [Symploca sp. SIO2G7]|nr:RIP metalloprotease RseP [Symploca sp. SIO2G7]